MNIMRIIYLIKYLIYGGISVYDYSIGSKYTLGWFLLAILMLFFFIDANDNKINPKESK